MAGTRPKQSRPFSRTRLDHARETAEDYVEAIADVIDDRGVCRGADLARLFAVSNVTVTKTVARLQNEGLIATRPYAPLELTPKGEKMAAKARRRHELVLKFLETIGVSRAQAAIDSEGIEHHVSDETLRAFQRFLASKTSIK